MRVAIYSTLDGKIDRRIDCPASMVSVQCQEGENFFLNCPEEANHIIDNAPLALPPARPPGEILLAEIRRDRDVKLAASDKYMLPDFPITEETRGQWRQYRQALRDMPETCDPENPIWPEMPA